MRALSILLLPGLLTHDASAMTLEDRETLSSALSVLQVRWDEEAARTAVGVFQRADSDVPGLVAFFEEFLSEHPLTSELSQFLGDRALTSESPAERRVLQEALAQLTVREIEVVLRSELPARFGPAFVADRARFEHLRASMELLGRLAFDGELSQSSRMLSYERLRGAIASYPGWLRKEARVDPDVHPPR